MKWFIILLLLIPTAHAATIMGTIYDYSFNQVDHAIITINTTPVQKIVATNGQYTINIDTGKYFLHVIRHLQAGEIESENQTIIIEDSGTYTLDFVLFPQLEEFEDLPIDNLFEEEQSTTHISTTILLIVGILLVLVGFFFLRKERKLKTTISPLEDDHQDALAIIKKSVRITQKDLRKQLPHSEAKTSLIITDLQDQGRIRKIKKGRSNILIFVK